MVNTAVATVLLIAFTVGTAGSALVLFQDLSGSARQDTDVQFVEEDDRVEIVSFTRTGNKYSAVVENRENHPVQLSFRQAGEIINPTNISSNGVKTVELGCLYSDAPLKLVSGSFTRKVDVLIPPRMETVQRGYCIDIEGSSIDTKNVGGQVKQFKEFEGQVYENTAGQDPYANKELDIDIKDPVGSGNKQKTVQTDSQGEFSFSVRWDLPYIPENTRWKREITYDRETSVMDFHRGRGEVQSPNRMRLDFDDGTSQSIQTQMVFRETKNNNRNMKYDVVPLKVNDTAVKFKIPVQVKAKQGMTQDWNDHSDSSDMLYQMEISDGGSYADVMSLSCESSSDVKCSTSFIEQTVDIPSAAGERFTRSTLPTDSSGKKFMNLTRQVTAQNSPYIGGLTSLVSFDYNGGNARYGVFEKEVFVPEDSSKTFQNPMRVHPEDAENRLESNYNLPGDEAEDRAETQYYARTQLVRTVGGWFNAPYSTYGNARFSLEDSNPMPNMPLSSKVPVATYNWTDVALGETYYLNYTVTLRRDEDNYRRLLLPINLGTHGVFPSDGGQAHHTYGGSGQRYTDQGETGSYSFSEFIPPQGSDDPIVYTTTFPEDDDTWTAKNWVLNTGDRRVENIYLLNSQANFTEFESMSGGDIGAGEQITKTIQLDPNQNKEVQANMQFQTISGAISAPGKSGWSYDSSVQVDAETDYDFDISDSVNCRPRYCINYRTGNRQSAVPITDLRGKDASKALFDEQVDSITFQMENGDSSSGGPQRLKNLGFWMWYLEPFTNNIADLLRKPESAVIKTSQNSNLRPAKRVQEFE